MRHRFFNFVGLITMTLAATWALTTSRDFPVAALGDRAMSIVRGGNPGQNYVGIQSCSEINAGTGLSEIQCEESGPFPASDTCVSCDDLPITYTMSPNGNPNIKLVQPLMNATYQCSGNKFVGTCIGASPLEGGPPAQCDLPAMPTGNCAGLLNKYIVQSQPGPN